MLVPYKVTRCFLERLNLKKERAIDSDKALESIRVVLELSERIEVCLAQNRLIRRMGTLKRDFGTNS